MALSGLRRRGAKFISVNPVRTGYSAIADEWLGIRPGTDGLFVLSLVHELLRADHVDLAYLGRYTNAAWLVIRDPGAADDGLFARNEAGEPLVLGRDGDARERETDRRRGPHCRRRDAARRAPCRAGLSADRRALSRSAIRARDGRPESAAFRPRASARLAAEIARVAFEQEIEIAAALDRLGRPPPRDDARPSGVGACDARHLGPFERVPDLPRAAPAADPDRHDRCSRRLALQIALPEAGPAGSEAGRQARRQVVAGKPLPGAPLGYPMGPEDLIIGDDGKPARIDKAFSWDAPIAAHGLMHLLIRNAGRATRTRSTRCSCTWPTWRGTRR